MKKRTFNYIILLVAVTFTAMLTSCGKPKELKIGDIHDVNVKSFGLGGIELEAVVPVQNPNSYTITAKEADLNLLADNKVIAHVTQTTPAIVIQGNSSADHTIGIKVDLLHPEEILSIINLLSGKAVLNLDGTLKLSSLVFTKTVVVHQTNIQQYLKPVVDKLRPF